MSAAYHALEDRIDQAIDALYHDLYTNCAVAARAFDVALRTLQRRWSGGGSRSTRSNANKALTDEQEQIIRDYIHRLDDINQCARSKMIVISKNAHTFRTPSPQPQLVERTPKGPESIRKFEEKITRALKDVGSNEDDITMTKKRVDRFQRYVRETMTAVNTLDLTTRDLIMMQQAAMKRKTRESLADTIAAKGGVMKMSVGSM